MGSKLGEEEADVSQGGEWLGSLTVEDRRGHVLLFPFVPTFALLPGAGVWGCDWRGLRTVPSSKWPRQLLRHLMSFPLWSGGWTAPFKAVAHGSVFPLTFHGPLGARVLMRSVVSPCLQSCQPAANRTGCWLRLCRDLLWKGGWASRRGQGCD